MSEGTQEQQMMQLELHLQKLINQPLREFQIKNGLTVDSIRFDLMYDTHSVKVKKVKQIIITYK